VNVYLCGGMRSGWQERVKSACPNHRFRDPCDSGLLSPADYTVWDLRAVVWCELVFAYMEADNPSGHGLCLEIGYALGMRRRPVLLVDEARRPDMAIVREAATWCVDSFDAGLERLRSIPCPGS